MGRKTRAEALGNKKAEESYNPYTHGQAEQLLPAVGAILKRTPAALKGDRGVKHRPKECVVVETNPLGLWYHVKFADSGMFECIKVPEV